MKKSFAILSGKGGAGKTLLATNLAAAFSEHKGSTLLVDADFGLPNAHIMFGVNPEKTIDNYISGKDTFEDIVYRLSPSLSIVAGKSGSSALVDLSEENGAKIWHGIRSVWEEFEYVIIDNSAGAENHTMSLSCIESELVISLVDLPTNFLDAYSTIKIANQEHKIKDFLICINQCNSVTNARKVFDKFNKITTQFLEVSLHYIGFLPRSNNIEDSITNREPFYHNKKNQEHALIDTIMKNLDGNTF